MRDEDDDLLRAAEELGIDLSGVRATDGEARARRRRWTEGEAARRTKRKPSRTRSIESEREPWD